MKLNIKIVSYHSSINESNMSELYNYCKSKPYSCSFGKDACVLFIKQIKQCNERKYIIITIQIHLQL